MRNFEVTVKVSKYFAFSGKSPFENWMNLIFSNDDLFIPREKMQLNIIMKKYSSDENKRAALKR